MNVNDMKIIDLGVLRISSFKQGLQGDSPDEQKEAIELGAKEYLIKSQINSPEIIGSIKRNIRK